MSNQLEPTCVYVVIRWNNATDPIVGVHSSFDDAKANVLRLLGSPEQVPEYKSECVWWDRGNEWVLAYDAKRDSCFKIFEAGFNKKVQSWAQKEQEEDDLYRLEQRRIEIDHIDRENANLLEFGLAVKKLTEELVEVKVKAEKP